MVRSFGLSGFRFYAPARYLISALFGDDLLLGLAVVSSFSWPSKTILLLEKFQICLFLLRSLLVAKQNLSLHCKFTPFCGWPSYL